ncbi:uncharacterized protein J7T54_000967 [Emericellopsis cladophorae]|uniref:Thioesterase domain-containing protein n=1 Tax=Emericellopsis cladophorae TaxID=2686198 RepID=A0A9Q0BFZ6_9HYPO|nr:uncharacterized protein J7T54_000967 [Emericellopsis cladophorae]KAI6782824.1 hypothetical protein J7T54_000967 [Emericellopsis cladophorae]
MDTILHIQGDLKSPKAPLILIHAISGLALPYLNLGPLDGRPVYGISAPLYEQGSAAPLPESLTEVGSLYVGIVRRHIQPHGPYVLGGWSMGGMIATEMAKILTAQGESVPHVIMIDSLNPEKYPPFHDAREHHLLATLTYNAIARRINGPEEPLGFAGQGVDTIPSGPSSAHASRDNSDGELDSDDEQVLADRFYHQMRQHVHHGLRMLASHRSSLSQGEARRLPETDATLVKCKTLDSTAPLLSEKRREFARRIHQDIRSGWADGQFRTLVTAPFRASHDSCLDHEFADELTVILQSILR